jgi:hypothetical protein
MMQLPVLLSPKFRAKFSNTFLQLPLNVTALCRIHCLTFQDKLFVNNPLDVKENDKHSLDFALHFPLGGLLLCLIVITIDLALITSDNPRHEGCILGGDLTKLLADTLLLLISCQK